MLRLCQRRKTVQGAVLARVQKFVGSLEGQGANKGVFVTTSSFSKQAEDYARHDANY